MFMEREKEMKDKFKTIQKDHDELMEERIYYKKYTDKLNDIIDDLRAKIEEETKIRKIFENKLNDLHSIVRDKEARYNRAKIDLDHLLQDNIDKNRQMEELQEEYKDVSKIRTAYQIKFDSINHILNTTRKDLESEKLSRHKEVTILTNTLNRTKEDLTKTKTTLNSAVAQLKGTFEDEIFIETEFKHESLLK
jgi:chromosome segregation ATPase